MAREYRVMTALAPTDVPVPETYTLCEDPAVLGAPFYVMQNVVGHVYRTAQAAAELGLPRLTALAGELGEVLARLHRTDPADVGLADFGRPEGYLERQLARWSKQLEASRSRELPGIDELRDRLAGSLPPTPRAAIVHGDYRLDNVIFGDDDRIAAVVDWEMATLGDPLTDLALFLIYQRFAPLMNGSIADASMAPGFLTEDEVLDRYAAASNRDLGGIGFYLGLAAYKLAVIAEGIYYRHLHGQTVGEGFAAVNSITEPLLEAGIGFVKGS
jgi:aminoglycoside phosphotransferase (APT) family kinase protein